MKALQQIILVVGILALPGCGGVIDWATETFDQGSSYKEDKELVAYYMRSKGIYDQFTTIALFDALWLSDDIRTLYTNAYAEMHGRSDEVRQTFLRRQLKTNEHFIDFYVLSTNAVPLNVKPVIWALYLKVGDVSYQPLEVKAVDIAPEYKQFFGKLLTNHKRVYEVRFERHDADGKDVLDGQQSIELYFSGPHAYTSVSWDLEHYSELHNQSEE